MDKLKESKRKHLSPELFLGCILIIFLVFIAILGPSLAPYGVQEFTDDLLAPMSSAHWFGTDGVGRDVATMILYGARTSLLIGVSSALISMVIGTAIGALSGYYGGWLDRFVNEIIHIFLMLPTFFLIIMVIAIFGSGFWKVALVIGFTSWMGTAKIMNAQTKSLKERTFIKAAKTIGESDFSIVWRYIIPHGILPVLSNVSMSVSSAILYEASLSFLGLGDPNLMSWGRIIYIGKNYMNRGWWVAAFGGLAIIITTFSFHMLSEGLSKLLQAERTGY